MKQWLRQHRYALHMALRRMIRQPFSSLTNVLVIALSLMLPLIGAIALSAAQPMLGQLTVDPQITLFLTRDVHTVSPAHVAQRLQTEHGAAIAALRIVPRDQALEQLTHNPGWSEALAVLTDNPLPDAIVVSLHSDTANQAVQAEALAQQWRQWEAVDHVQLDSEWVQRLHALLETLRIALTLLALGVGVVVLATTFNTVRMQALGQREDIAVARLLGATESFVRRPFLYLGTISGVVSSLLAIAMTRIVLTPLNNALAQLSASDGVTLTLHLPSAATLLLALVSVAALCALATRWSVTRTTCS